DQVGVRNRAAQDALRDPFDQVEVALRRGLVRIRAVVLHASTGLLALPAGGQHRGAGDSGTEDLQHPTAGQLVIGTRRWGHDFLLDLRITRMSSKPSSTPTPRVTALIRNSAVPGSNASSRTAEQRT